MREPDCEELTVFIHRRVGLGFRRIMPFIKIKIRNYIETSTIIRQTKGGRDKTNFALALMKTQQVLQTLHTLLIRLSVREGVS